MLLFLHNRSLNKGILFWRSQSEVYLFLLGIFMRHLTYTWWRARPVWARRNPRGNPLCRLARWITPPAAKKDNFYLPARTFWARTSPADTMSKPGSLKVKGLFKLKSPGKDNKEPKQSGSLKDGAATGPTDQSRTLPASPGPLSPGDSATLAGDALPISPKAKKGLRLPFKMKRKKSKRKDAEGGEVFFPETDELDSFSSHRWDQNCFCFFILPLYSLLLQLFPRVVVWAQYAYWYLNMISLKT